MRLSGPAAPVSEAVTPSAAAGNIQSVNTHGGVGSPPRPAKSATAESLPARKYDPVALAMRTYRLRPSPVLQRRPGYCRTVSLMVGAKVAAAVAADGRFVPDACR
jgi:hypothetical protein